MTNCLSKLSKQIACVFTQRKADGQWTGRTVHIWFNQSASRGGLLKY